MTLEELWELFPISLVAPRDGWKDDYREIEVVLKNLLSDRFAPRISHIGSTAIGGIWAKNIVDVLVEFPSDKDLNPAAEILKQNGFLLMSSGPKGISFNKGYTKEGFADKVYHIHIRYIGDNDELYLGFRFTDHIEAGVPYFVQPAQNVENPTFADVTINRTLQPTEIAGVITFKGIYSPTQLQAETEEDHSILMLMANNELTFPNVTGNMKGMRAYFQTSGYVAHIARRASFEVGEHQMPTELETIDGTQCIMHDGKYIMNGRFVIVKENKIYNAQGQKVQ